jgi:hypothetical protein
MEIQDLTRILFLDIETVSQSPGFSGLDARFRKAWERKSLQFGREADPAETYPEKAGVYAEFARVVVIAAGWFSCRGGNLRFRTRVFQQPDEKDLLREFSAMLDSRPQGSRLRLCAHNGKEFDFPFLCRRMIIQAIALPPPLRIMGKRPWELPHLIDTLDLWKFGDYKAYTSLETLATCMGIPGSKTEFDGSQVGPWFHGNGDIRRIATYCQKDVVVLAQVFLRMMGLPSLEPGQILLQA